MGGVRPVTSPYKVVVDATDRFERGESTDLMPPLDLEEGTQFGWNERLFLSWREGKVLDYGDWAARDIDDMFGNYYKATQLESAICGPIEGAVLNIKPAPGDRGEAEFWNTFAQADEFSGGMLTPQDLILSQLTSAFSYRKAYFEKVWTRGRGQFEKRPDGKQGSIVYSKIAYRPASTCRTVRTPQGQVIGFEQDPWYLGSVGDEQVPDVIEVPNKRAVIYVHGQRRDPVNGVSDMQITHWCYQTMKRVLFLWIRYAEGLSLPRTTVMANDITTARQIAQQVAKAGAAATIPLAAPGGANNVAIDTLDVSGKGGEQFKALIDWLDQAAVNSNGAGFLSLTDHEKSGGSWALSSNASDTYLQRLQAKAKEQAREYRRQVIAPFTLYNFGPGAAVPLCEYEPLNVEDIAPQIAMLQALMASRDPSLVPNELIEEVAALVAERWGLDVTKVRQGVQDAQDRATKAAEAQQANQAQIASAKVSAGVDAMGRQVKKAVTGRD